MGLLRAPTWNSEGRKGRRVNPEKSSWGKEGPPLPKELGVFPKGLGSQLGRG